MKFFALLQFLRRLGEQRRDPPATRPDCQSPRRLAKEAKWALRRELLNHPIYQRMTKAQLSSFGVGVSQHVRRDCASRQVKAA